MAVHVHKLKKHKYKTGQTIFFCILPDCNFKIEAALALGKRTLCNNCNAEFIINEYTLKLVKPHCLNCGKIKVRGADGKSRFIRRTHTSVLADAAANNVEDLRSRLGSVTLMDSEEDI